MFSPCEWLSSNGSECPEMFWYCKVILLRIQATESLNNVPTMVQHTLHLCICYNRIRYRIDNYNSYYIFQMCLNLHLFVINTILLLKKTLDFAIVSVIVNVFLDRCTSSTNNLVSTICNILSYLQLKIH